MEQFEFRFYFTYITKNLSFEKKKKTIHAAGIMFTIILPQPLFVLYVESIE